MIQRGAPALLLLSTIVGTLVCGAQGPIRDSARPAETDSIRDTAVQLLRLQPVPTPFQIQVRIATGQSSGPVEATRLAKDAIERDECPGAILTFSAGSIYCRLLDGKDAVVYSCAVENGIGWGASSDGRLVAIAPVTEFGWSAIGLDLMGASSQTGIGFDGLSSKLQSVWQEVRGAANVRLSRTPDKLEAKEARIEWDFDRPGQGPVHQSTRFCATVKQQLGSPCLTDYANESWRGQVGSSECFGWTTVACNDWRDYGWRVLPRSVERMNAILQPDDKWVYNSMCVRLLSAQAISDEKLSQSIEALRHPAAGTNISWFGLSFHGSVGSNEYALGPQRFASSVQLRDATMSAIWDLLSGTEACVAQPSQPPHHTYSQETQAVATEHEFLHAFGNVDLEEETTRHSHDFNLPAGVTSTSVKRITTTCGCTTASCIDRPDLPSAVRVTLSLDKLGKKSGRVLVLLNDERLLKFEVTGSGVSRVRWTVISGEIKGTDSFEIHALATTALDQAPPSGANGWRALPLEPSAPVKYWLASAIIRISEIDRQRGMCYFLGIGEIPIPADIQVEFARLLQ